MQLVNMMASKVENSPELVTSQQEGTKSTKKSVMCIGWNSKMTQLNNIVTGVTIGRMTQSVTSDKTQLVTSTPYYDCVSYASSLIVYN